MGCWYAISGEIKVRDCPEAKALTENFDWFEGAKYVPNGDGTATVSFNGGDHVSYDDVEDIGASVEEFGTFVPSGCLVSCWQDDDRGHIYVGPPEQEREVQSRRVLEEINQRLSELTETDRRLLAVLCLNDSPAGKH